MGAPLLHTRGVMEVVVRKRGPWRGARCWTRPLDGVDEVPVDVTSHSSVPAERRFFSPFLLRATPDALRALLPPERAERIIAESARRNGALPLVENVWQGLKVYRDDLGADGKPGPAWDGWSDSILLDAEPRRFPRGKRHPPVAFHWVRAGALDYVQARLRVYAPLYVSAVRAIPAAVEYLHERRDRARERGVPLVLYDFDGYEREKHDTLAHVARDTTRPMGHAFVLEALVRGEMFWSVF